MKFAALFFIMTAPLFARAEESYWTEPGPGGLVYECVATNHFGQSFASRSEQLSEARAGAMDACRSVTPTGCKLSRCGRVR